MQSRTLLCRRRRRRDRFRSRERTGGRGGQGSSCRTPPSLGRGQQQARRWRRLRPRARFFGSDDDNEALEGGPRRAASSGGKTATAASCCCSASSAPHGSCGGRGRGRLRCFHGGDEVPRRALKRTMLFLSSSFSSSFRSVSFLSSSFFLCNATQKELPQHCTTIMKKKKRKNSTGKCGRGEKSDPRFF